MKIMERIDAFADIGWEGDREDQGRDCLPYSENENLAFGEFEAQSRRLIELADARGMELDLKTDKFKNAYLTLKGRSDRKVMICSHLDSVVRGGRYDGITGVSAGLEVIQRFIEEGVTPNKGITAAAFRAEESSVTGMSCIGSTLATGQYSISNLREIYHKQMGITLLGLLAELGVDEKELEHLRANPELKAEDFDAVLELHIEQSDVLNSMNEPFGIVIHGIGGSRRSRLLVESSSYIPNFVEGRRVRVCIKGRTGHSGGTPMNEEVIGGEMMNIRKDALLAAASYLSSREGRLKISNFCVPNGTYNQVPGECSFDLIMEENEDVDSVMEGIIDHLSKGMDLAVEELPAVVVDLIRESVVKAAMEIVVSVESIATELAKTTKGRIRATIGALEVFGGKMELFMDQRILHPDFGELATSFISDQLARIESENGGVTISEVGVVETKPVPFRGHIQDLMRAKYRQIYEADPVQMGSMPGHDAAKVISARRDGRYVPGGMVYVRSRNGGISHHPSELSHEDDIEFAADFLFEVVKEL